MKELFEKSMLAALENGTIENVIQEQIEKSVKEITENLFSYRGDIKSTIEDKLKAQLIPQIEAYDFSRYVTKLDHVMTEVLKQVSHEPKEILENFKEFMTVEIPKKIKASELFEKYKDFCSKNVNTDDLEKYMDDSPYYQMLEVRCYVGEIEDQPSWYKSDYKVLFFECEQDETLNKSIEFGSWSFKDTKYASGNKVLELTSLRHMDEFEIFLIQLAQRMTDIDMDITEESDEIEVDATPEVSYSLD